MAVVETYEVTIIKYGTRTTLRSDVYLNYSVYAEVDGPIVMDYFVWIIRNPNRTVVVDTGFSRQGAESRGRTVLIDVPQAFRAAGVDPSASPLVILTHAHYDHVGNLDEFPTSQFLISEREYEFWTSGRCAHRQFQHSVESDDIQQLARAAEEGRVTTFAGSHIPAPGIEVLEVGGHTPGQSIVKVSTSEGTVLLASDAIHFYEEYERDMPFTYATDLVGVYETFDKIRQMAACGEISHLVSGHDPGTLELFTPASGDLAGLASTIGGVELGGRVQ